jgi:hypothetical protein
MSMKVVVFSTCGLGQYVGTAKNAPALKKLVGRALELSPVGVSLHGNVDDVPVSGELIASSIRGWYKYMGLS